VAAKECARCKKLFDYVIGPPLCRECKEQDEKDFHRIKDFLYENPNSTMADISKELNISVRKITRFLKEGRLETKKFKNIVLRCKKCGTPIDNGDYCSKCMLNLRKEMLSSVKQSEKHSNVKDDSIQKKNDRMIVIDRYKSDK
jgi:flagellar operon protein (TIGR03826 family)